jgi:hypothetical protein
MEKLKAKRTSRLGALTKALKAIQAHLEANASATIVSAQRDIIREKLKACDKANDDYVEQLKDTDIDEIEASESL